MSGAFGVTPLLGWLGWQSVYAMVAGVVVFGLTHLFRIRDPRWLSGLWVLVLLRFLLPVDLALPWGLGSLWHQFGTPSVPLVESAASPASVTLDVDARVAAEGHGALWQVGIVLIWIAGVLGMLVFMLGQQIRLHRMLHQALHATPEAEARVRHWRAIFGVRRPVRLNVGDTVALPFTTGIFVPRIYLAQSHLQMMTPVELDAVLAHEFAHIRSHDMVWLYLERIVQLLFFFHPLAWWATHQLTQARERCCDIDAVDISGMHAGRYWDSVLSLLQRTAESSPRLAIASPLGRSARTLKARIAAVQLFPRMRLRSRLVVGCGLAMLGALLLPMAPVARTSAVPAAITAPGQGLPPLAAPSELELVNARVLQAKAQLARYRAGDFGDHVITGSDGTTRCAAGSRSAGVECGGVFSRRDIGQLVWEAEDELEKAEHALARLKSSNSMTGGAAPANR